jgi:hypothetical protein
LIGGGKFLLELAGQRGEVCVRLFDGRAVADPAHRMNPHATLGRCSRREFEGQDEIRGGRGRKSEPARRHADDRRPRVPQLNRSTDDVGTRAKARRPQVMADEDDRRCAFAQIVGLDEAAERGLHAQRPEEFRRRRQALKTDGIDAIEQRGLRIVECHDGLERLLTLAQIDDVAHGHEVLANAGAHVFVLEHHQPGGVGERQRSQQDRLDHGKERRVHANAEGKGQHGRGTKARFTSEQPERLTDVTSPHGTPFLSLR